MSQKDKNLIGETQEALPLSKIIPANRTGRYTQALWTSGVEIEERIEVEGLEKNTFSIPYDLALPVSILLLLDPFSQIADAAKYLQ